MSLSHSLIVSWSLRLFVAISSLHSKTRRIVGLVSVNATDIKRDTRARSRLEYCHLGTQPEDENRQSVAYYLSTRRHFLLLLLRRVNGG